MCIGRIYRCFGRQHGQSYVVYLLEAFVPRAWPLCGPEEWLLPMLLRPGCEDVEESAPPSWRWESDAMAAQTV